MVVVHGPQHGPAVGLELQLGRPAQGLRRLHGREVAQRPLLGLAMLPPPGTLDRRRQHGHLEALQRLVGQAPRHPPGRPAMPLLAGTLARRHQIGPRPQPRALPRGLLRRPVRRHTGNNCRRTATPCHPAACQTTHRLPVSRPAGRTSGPTRPVRQSRRRRPCRPRGQCRPSHRPTHPSSTPRVWLRCNTSSPTRTPQATCRLRPKVTPCSSARRHRRVVRVYKASM